MTFLTAVVIVVWLIAILAASCYGMDKLLDGQFTGDAVKGGIAMVVAILLFAGLIAMSHESRLCSRGHEEYQLIGKIMQRVWVCEEYAPQ